MMNKGFREDIWETLEVYMDDLIVKSIQEEFHDQHLWQVFKRVRQYNMNLNRKKWEFGVKSDNFLGFYLT